MFTAWWKSIEDLIDEQSDILDIDFDESFLITGPPGSGKTNLLLLRANQLYLNQRKNIRVVVFGSLLRTYIQLGGQQYKFPQDRVVTHTRLFSSVLAEHDIVIDSSLPINKARSARAAALADLLERKRIGKLFEVLLLDEAQDYSPEEIEVLAQISDVLIATADVRQRVYSDIPDCSDKLVHAIATVRPLIYHHRNGLSVCRLADGIMKGKPDHASMYDTSQYNEQSYPSSVTACPGLAVADQAVAIANALDKQRIAYPNELIGIICPTKACCEEIAAVLQTLGHGDFITMAGTSSFNPERPIWIATLAGSKGLEFRALHIGGLDYLSSTGPAQRRLIFTGVTRGRTSVSLYWNTKIPPYLESAVQTFIKKYTPVGKQDLFGK